MDKNGALETSASMGAASVQTDKVVNVRMSESELPGLYATERMESFWATAPLAQHDTAKQDDLVLNADHMLDATRYLLMATQDNRYQSVSGRSTKIRVW